jgi:Flp pilus assembly pilin Flp
MVRIVELWQKSRVCCISARVRLSSGREDGAAAVEYGVMIAMIAAVVILSVIFLGHQTSRAFSCTANAIQVSAQC